MEKKIHTRKTGRFSPTNSGTDPIKPQLNVIYNI